MSGTTVRHQTPAQPIERGGQCDALCVDGHRCRKAPLWIRSNYRLCDYHAKQEETRVRL